MCRRRYSGMGIMNREHLYFVILAGGSGERLWPLSRMNRPKQLLQIPHHTTLLEQTIERIRPLVFDASHIWISTTASHAPAINQLVGTQIGTIVIEPDARNTGPALLYTCHQL